LVPAHFHSAALIYPMAAKTLDICGIDEQLGQILKARQSRSDVSSEVTGYTILCLYAF